MIAGDVGGRRSNHIGGKTGRRKRRVQAFGGRWSGDGLEGEKVSDGAGGRRKLKVRGVDDFLRERSAAGDVNGLGAVMGFLAAGASGLAGLSAAEVFGAWKFVAGIVDHFVGTQFGRGVGPEAIDLAWKDDDDEDQKRFQQP